MNKTIVFGILAVCMGSSAFAASTRHCIKSPVIECRPGFEVKLVRGCFTCAPEQESEPLCVKAPRYEPMKKITHPGERVV